MTNYVEGKSVLITGAGNGFGKLTAQRAAARGARVLCVDIDGAKAEEAATEIRASGGIAEAVSADVTRIEDMQAAVAAAAERHGGLDILVNNAGIMPLAFLADHAAALGAWNRCIDINFKGVMNGTVAAYDRMMAQGHGHIVNLSSIFGNYPVVGGAVYGATKAAVDYFSHSVRVESRGVIKVTVVKPTGVVATGLGQGVVNREAGGGIIGHHTAPYRGMIERLMGGTSDPAELDPESPAYASLAPGYIADAILHAIDQPAGVVISDVTVRATGDYFIL